VREFTNTSIVKGFGSTIWDASKIPYEDQYAGKKVPKQSLASFVKAVMRHAPSKPESQEAIPSYVFSAVTGGKGVDTLFPHYPKLITEGLPGVVRFESGRNSQV